VTAWTKPGPFRWEGEHFHYRYVNPWARPFQDPHPPIWIPGVMSRNTVAWSAKHRYPYIMLATELEPTRQSFLYYDECAKEHGRRGWSAASRYWGLRKPSFG
jgi:alkanesulfonate monooxygenase SsuD/methylene tetrahydromethanopterin reductase-like flavin-dependent oxidoreductase (luciferase family)